jgi:hypothetical protein
MRMILVLCLSLFAVPALAQQQPDLPPIDRDLWTAMSLAFGNISMPLPAHQQVQQILQSVEAQAAQRKAQRDAAAAEAAKAKAAAEAAPK